MQLYYKIPDIFRTIGSSLGEVVKKREQKKKTELMFKERSPLHIVILMI
jgi:hypothetical protein